MTQSRRMLVLRAVVEDYIRSQEPVGSTTLTKDHDLGVSSATVRNDMAALEDEGYLIQPHTSAGRIPTEKGYRYFVDRLATVVPMSEAQRRGINSFLSGSVNLQDTLQRAARLLAQITGQVAVVAAPLAKSTLRHIEIVPVSINTLLAVVITDTGRVAQHILNVSELPDTTVLSHLVNEINAQCASVSLTRTADYVRQMSSRKEYRPISKLAETLAQAFDGMADDERASELYMAGTSRLAHQRAVADLAPLFDALEEQVVLMKLMSTLSETTQSDGVGVAIGSETHTPGLLHASVVTSGYGRTSATADDVTKGETAEEQGRETSNHTTAAQDSTEPLAFVGSIGPTHMDYAATMAAVRAVARYLTAFVAHDENQNNS
jgi:heat-inducible transcriptional repressor